MSTVARGMTSPRLPVETRYKRIQDHDWGRKGMDDTESHKSALGSQAGSGYAAGAVLLISLVMGLAFPAYGAVSHDCRLVAQANHLVGGKAPPMSSLRVASAHGHRTAQVLGSLYYGYRYQNLGQIIPQSKAREILRRIRTAARGGNPLSVYVYGGELISMGKAHADPALVRHGEHLIRIAFPRLVKRAHAPCAALYQFALAGAYTEGVAVPRNLRQSFLWARRSARGGSSMGQALVGGYYVYEQKGDRQQWKPPINCAKGLKWLRRSAASGNPKAKAGLGVLYSQGMCVRKAPRKAVLLFQSAARRGFAQGYVGLGYCYLHGLGVRRSSRRALNSFVHAIREGDTAAIGTAWKISGSFFLRASTYYDTGTNIVGIRKDILALHDAAREGFESAGGFLNMLDQFAQIKLRQSKTPLQKARAKVLAEALAPFSTRK